jgi:hypothetical protein
MGQQIPFETLEIVASALGVEATDQANGRSACKTRRVRLGELEVPRVETCISNGDGNRRDVDIYEAYWAPLTEGRVTVRDVIWFLIRSGIDGARHARRRFDRWIFGGRVTFERRLRGTEKHFWFALAFVLALVLINSVIVSVAGARLLTGGGSAWPTDALLVYLTVEFFFVGVLLGIPGLALFRRWRDRVRVRPSASLEEAPSRFSAWWGWPSVWLGLIGTIVIALLILPTLAYDLIKPNEDYRLSIWWLIGIWIFWACMLLLSSLVRRVIVQYVGDVVAYISAHSVNKFSEVRRQIFESCISIAQAIYSERCGEGEDFRYAKVIIVGHSLGSVIAYDVLNGLLLREELRAKSWKVTERTGLLLTMGSPLDKTAFIFRRQKWDDLLLRERLAEAVQPLIKDYRYRPDNWVNIHSPHDWISGSLDYYDNEKHPDFDKKRVRNEIDPDATTPLVAHTEYWENPRLAEVLREAVLS